MPDAGGVTRHYGSTYTMSDYESKVHNIYFTANYMPMEKLRVFGSLIYNMAEASLDEVVMAIPPASQTEDSEGDEGLENANYDFSLMHDYSNLDYTMLNFNVGFEYRLTSRMTFTTDGTYIDLTDDEGYVYGDETGSFFMIRSGFKIDF